MKTRFKGHETFYFREGWLSKAIFEMDNDRTNSLFSGNNGIAKLGVGANMVKSIKYWLIASNLIHYDRTKKIYKLTTLGEIIARNDVYLEDIFSLWIIHINIVRNKAEATTWYLFFNEFKGDVFTSDDVKKVIKNYLISNEIDFSEKSIDVDVNLLLNMYVNEKECTNAEENYICPLTQLNILKRNKELFIRNVPNLNCLNEYVVLYAMLSIEQFYSKKYISITLLESGDNSLVNLFNINRVVINEYLELLASQGYIRIEKTAGLDMVYLIKDIKREDVVEEYYRRRGIL